MEHKTADELKRELEYTIATQQRIEDRRRHLEIEEANIHSFMKKYEIICEEMKEAYQGKTSSQILGLMLDDGRQARKDMYANLSAKHEDMSYQYKKLQIEEELLSTAYKLQMVREEENAVIN